MLLVPYREDFYRESHPEPHDVLLLIEVSHSSLEYDLRIELPLYARAGIQEVWVVDLDAGSLQVNRGPGPGGYESVRILSPGDRVAPLALPEIELTLADILP